MLYAHRPLARQLLERATERDTPMGRLRVISVEGLIGFKLQGYVNDATRTRDLDDIRALVRQHRATLNTQELQSYFALFHQLDLFHALLDRPLTDTRCCTGKIHGGNGGRSCAGTRSGRAICVCAG